MEQIRLKWNEISNCLQGLASSQLKLFGSYTKPKDMMAIIPPLACEHMEIQTDEWSSST